MTTQPKALKLTIRAIIILWGYDIVKFFLVYDLLISNSINPWIFFFLDMVTVPTYIIGWKRLLLSLAHKPQPSFIILRDSVITAISSTTPYLYATWAGRETLPIQAWVILALIIIFPLINLARKLYFVIDFWDNLLVSRKFFKKR